MNMVIGEGRMTCCYLRLSVIL